VSLAVAGECLADWTVHPHWRGSDMAAFALTNGTEIHFVVMPAYRNRTIFRRITAEFLRPMFEVHGFLTTRVEHGDAANTCFIERLGFVESWRDPAFVYYVMTALPFTGSK